MQGCWNSEASHEAQGHAHDLFECMDLQINEGEVNNNKIWLLLV